MNAANTVACIELVESMLQPMNGIYRVELSRWVVWWWWAAFPDYGADVLWDTVVALEHMRALVQARRMRERGTS